MIRIKVNSLLAILMVLLISQPAISENLPTFEGAIGAPRGPREEATQGRSFNRFMRQHKGQVVELFVFLDKAQQRDFEEGLLKPDHYNRVVFDVRDDYSQDLPSGNEYLLHLPANKEKYNFEYIKGAGRLSGRFKIFDINGPRQGFMSVNIRPVD